MKKKDLLTIAKISSPTIAKLTKGEIITTEVINKICHAFTVQPGDIMEYMEDETAECDAKLAEVLTAFTIPPAESAEGE
jgi:DNA-binding Xre family transcriptional regulator